MDALPNGTRIGAYVIERLLSDQGGFSLVYLARHPVHGAVAMKECVIAGHVDRFGTRIVPRPERCADFDWTRARFRQEARFLLGNGRHPHVVTAYDMIEANDTVYLAMELLQESLDDQLARHHRQTPQDVSRWLGQIADALVFCENQGCHHLDIAPKNIMFDKHGQANLIDFGFSRLGNASRLRTSRLATTDGYSPLEKYTFSSRDLESRSDVYSLAATMVRALAGEEPIDSRARNGSLHFVPNETEAALRAGVGPAAYRVLEKALAVQKSDRFITVASFIAAWDTTHPRMATGPTERLPKAAERQAVTSPDLVRRRKIAVLVCIVLVALLGIVWAIAGSYSDPSAASEVSANKE